MFSPTRAPPTATAAYKLGQMILPQLEAGTHGVELVGMFFFDDNNFVLRQGDPLGERLTAVAADKGMLLMMCDMCALERNLAEGEPRWWGRLGAHWAPDVPRHTFATLYQKSNPDDLRGLAALLVRNDLNTLMVYTEPTLDDLAERMERIETPMQEEVSDDGLNSPTTHP